jgi:hypothetical protein
VLLAAENARGALSSLGYKDSCGRLPRIHRRVIGACLYGEGDSEERGGFRGGRSKYGLATHEEPSPRNHRDSRPSEHNRHRRRVRPWVGMDRFWQAEALGLARFADRSYRTCAGWVPVCYVGEP